MKFKVADDAYGKIAAIGLQYEQNNSFNVEIHEVPFTLQSGSIAVSEPLSSAVTVTLDANGGTCEVSEITVTSGEAYGALPTPTRDGFRFDGWYTSDGTPVTESTICSATEDHTLTALWTEVEAVIDVVEKENSETVLDDEKHVVYGFDPSDLRSEAALQGKYLDVTGNGHLEIEPSAMDTIGTGAVIHLVDNDTGETIKSYTIIVFGDVNGDGLYNVVDVSIMRLWTAGMLEFDDEAFELAGDVDHNGICNIIDTALIRSASSGTETIEQSNW